VLGKSRVGFVSRLSRLTGVVGLLLVVALLIAACTGAAEPDQAADDADDTDQPAAPADGGDIKVVPFLTAESSPDAVTQITALIEQFEADNPGVLIELQLISNEGRASRIINAISVGDQLGIFEIERQLVPDFTQAGYLLPLDDMVESIGLENFAPGSLLYWPWDGHLYQFPADVSASATYWRQDLYDEAGLGDPDSYERFLEASERLHGQDGMSGNGQEISNARAVQGFSNFLWQNCGDYFDKQGELVFDSDEARQSAHDYAALNEYAPEGSHTWGSFDPIGAYAAGRTTTQIFPGRLGYEVGTNAPEIAEVTSVGQTNVSHDGDGPGTVYGAITSYAIGSTVQHPDEARAFLEFILTGDALVDYALGVPGHIIPALVEGQQGVLDRTDNDYVAEHADWIEAHHQATEWFNHEAQNMGSMDGCDFNRSLVPMPWAPRVMGSAPLIATMFQEISLQGRDVDEAYDDAVEGHREARESWLEDNDWWEPPDPDWEPPGS
jgi:multiple sugar transport system substrate-binding protein